MEINDRITTTIKREWLAQIIAGTKKIEHRQIKVHSPFCLYETGTRPVAQ